MLSAVACVGLCVEGCLGGSVRFTSSSPSSPRRAPRLASRQPGDSHTVHFVRSAGVGKRSRQTLRSRWLRPAGLPPREWCVRRRCAPRRQRAEARRARQSVTLHTTLGDLKVEVYCEEVPRSAENFLALCASGYYDGTKFHRRGGERSVVLVCESMAEVTNLAPQKHQGLHGAGRRPHGCVLQCRRGATAPRGALSPCAAQARVEAAPASGAASFPTSFATR